MKKKTRSYVVTLYKTEEYVAHLSVEAESEEQAELIATQDGWQKGLDWASQAEEIEAYAVEVDNEKE